MNTNFFRNLVEQKLMSLHTAFLATVLSVNGKYADIQPLSLIKAYNKEAKEQAMINNVPICKHALEDVLEGCTVLCVCCERDISQTRKGNFALPSYRHHSLSDSVIVGVIEE